jgi:hypothetical protein
MRLMVLRQLTERIVLVVDTETEEVTWAEEFVPVKSVKQHKSH